MAFDNCDFVQAKEKVNSIRNNAWKNRKEWPLIKEYTNNKPKKEIGRMSTESEESDKNNNVVQNIKEIIKKNNKGKIVELLYSKVEEEQQSFQSITKKVNTKENKEENKIIIKEEKEIDAIQIKIEPDEESNIYPS